MDIEKFTERARGFIQAAQTIAIREFHQQLAPEHLLKAFLDDEEGAAAGLIRAAGGDDKTARAAIDAEVAKIPKVQGQGAGQPQITPALVRVLDASQQAAQKAGDAYVAQDRVLVALANGEGGAARALRNAGATAQALEKAVAEIRKGRKVTSPNAEANFDALKKYARDVTALAREGKLDPVIGRDEEIRRTIQVLARRTKNNPVLIGEPGVGKTAIVEGLAQRIVAGEVPDTLKDKRVLVLDMAGLLAEAPALQRLLNPLRRALAIGFEGRPAKPPPPPVAPKPPAAKPLAPSGPPSQTGPRPHPAPRPARFVSFVRVL